MTLDRLILIALTVVGAALTLGGLIGAVLGTYRQLRLEGERIEQARALADEEAAESRSLTPGQRADDELWEERLATWRARYADAGITRPQWDVAPLMSAIEAQRIVRLLLDGARSNLITAGAGVVVSTAASIWSLTIG